MMTSEKKWSVEEIREMLDTNPKAVVRGVVVLFKLQTDEEQAADETRVHNKQGFNAFDAEILSSFAKQLLAGRTLSEKQFSIAKKKIRKYARQLARVANGDLKVS